MQLWDPTDPFEPREPSISPVTDGQVRRLLEDPVASPLANQTFGGKVTLKRVAQSLIGRTPRRDLQDLARMVILSVAIGNLDMHAKNIGLLHLESGRVRLAPAYDMVPHLRLAGNDGRMALAINGKYVHANISTSDIETELQSWRLPNVRKMITETLENILEVVHKEEPDPRSQPLLRDDLYQITASLLAGQPIGKLDN